MTNLGLALSYAEKASKRIAVLDVLLAQQSWSDVIREAQEVVELCLKAMLRQVGIDPPKWHDVGPLLIEHCARLPEDVRPGVARIAAISAALRQERELAFYGDIDFIPSEEYTPAEARCARDDAAFVVSQCLRVVPLSPGGQPSIRRTEE
jgi:hypothetical protein